MERERPVVLVVEDDPQAAELLRLYLEGAGYRVEVAWDGEEGFTKACQLHPALITLDLLLPKVDGWDLLVRLKGEPDDARDPGGHRLDHGASVARGLPWARLTTWSSR